MLRPARRLVCTGVEYTWTTADLLDQTFVCVYVNDKTDQSVLMTVLCQHMVPVQELTRHQTAV